MPTLTCPIPQCGFVTQDGEIQAITALLTIHGYTHNVQGAAAASIKKPDRPVVGLDMSESEWAQFIFEFDNYKRDCGITTKQEKVRSELLNCCDKSIRQRLFMMKGTTLNNESEEQLKVSIKSAAVSTQTQILHRDQFYRLNQSQGETPQAFMARLNSKALLCNFLTKIKCSESCTKDRDREVSYRENVVESQLITGLYNPEHRQKLLVEGDKNPSLEAKLNVLDNLHTLENSQNPSEARTDSRSGYSSKKREENPGGDSKRRCECGAIIASPNEKHKACKSCFEKLKTKQCKCGTKILPSKKSCFPCGKQKRDEAKSDDYTADESSHDAYMFTTTAVPEEDVTEEEILEEDGVTMTVLSSEEKKAQRSWARELVKSEKRKRNFEENNCEADSSLDSSSSQSDMGSWNLDDEKTSEESSEEEFSEEDDMEVAELKIESSEKQDEDKMKIPHSRWNGKEFVKAEIMPQPECRAKMTIMFDAMRNWKEGKNIKTKAKTTAQSLIEKFGHSSNHLADSGAQTYSVPMEKCRAMGANEEDLIPTSLRIRGASGAFLDVLGVIMAKIEIGKKVTRQLIYVISKADRCVLSREALIELGIISKTFPEQLKETQEKESYGVDASKKCKCGKREATPHCPRSCRWRLRRRTGRN